MKAPENIILSRTDGIGDMVLMLPMAAVIRMHFPDAVIAVLGKSYTRALVEACSFADEFIDEKDFFSDEITIRGAAPAVFINVRTNKAAARRAKELGIPVRIGTKSRLYHFLTCNRLVKLKRKSSDLHEAQLNLKLLEPLGIARQYSAGELQQMYGLTKLQTLSEENTALLSREKYNLIIHPKSQGSSREWPLAHFIALINSLDENIFKIFLSGVEKEKKFIDEIICGVSKPVVSLAGKMPLPQFLSFIKASDGILANATGPLHLGAALGIDAFGLYPPMKPLDPGRWAPLGPRAQVFVLKRSCSDCRNDKMNCHCMSELEPALIHAALNIAAHQKSVAANHE